MCDSTECLLHEVSDLGVVIAYAPHLQGAAVWVPEERLLVLNAEESRARLCAVIHRALPQIRREAANPA